MHGLKVSGGTCTSFPYLFEDSFSPPSALILLKVSSSLGLAAISYKTFLNCFTSGLGKRGLLTSRLPSIISVDHTFRQEYSKPLKHKAHWDNRCYKKKTLQGHANSLAVHEMWQVFHPLRPSAVLWRNSEGGINFIFPWIVWFSRPVMGGQFWKLRKEPLGQLFWRKAPLILVDSSLEHMHLPCMHAYKYTGITTKPWIRWGAMCSRTVHITRPGPIPETEYWIGKWCSYPRLGVKDSWKDQECL